jgi:hypothetical protein
LDSSSKSSSNHFGSPFHTPRALLFLLGIAGKAAQIGLICLCSAILSLYHFVAEGFEGLLFDILKICAYFKVCMRIPSPTRQLKPYVKREISIASQSF